MSQSAAPWRALEDSAPAGVDNANGATATGSAAAASGIGRSMWIGGALATAGLVAVAAVWLVASGGRGTLVVEGDGAVPGRSGRRFGHGVSHVFRSRVGRVGRVEVFFRLTSSTHAREGVNPETSPTLPTLPLSSRGQIVADEGRNT